MAWACELGVWNISWRYKQGEPWLHDKLISLHYLVIEREALMQEIMWLGR